MSGPAGLLDSHTHLDIVKHCHPERIQWLREHHCAVISWAFAPRGGDAADLAEYLKSQAQAIESINRDGPPCRFLAGIHPRNIPADLTPAQCADFLRPFLEHPLCLGIGEIGLETGDDRETLFFLAQLELGRVCGSNARLGVHTPRKNKADITKRILGVLGKFPDLKGRLVVDHCTPETVGEVLDQGWTAGVTLSPVKSSFADLRAIVRLRPDGIGRILCNTDSGADFYEELVSGAAAGDFLPAVRDALFGGNAAHFFGWNPTHP